MQAVSCLQSTDIFAGLVGFCDYGLNLIWTIKLRPKGNIEENQRKS